MNEPRKILVADDNRELALAISHRLKSAGYKVYVAVDAYNALACAVREKVDLMLLDIHMPAGTGFSVQERLARIPRLKQPPIIYLTGDHSEYLLQTATRINSSLLYKPISPRAIVEVVDRMLTLHAA